MNRIPAGGRLGRYQIERMLGAGAMGEVYLAEDPQIGRRVAIKTVRVEEGKPAEVEERKRRLLREARAAGKLLHPHVVALFDAGEDQGVLYLAFECVEGMDLAQRLEQDPPLTLREALHYVRQAAEGLDYAHRQGIVHRDIKPSNLLLNASGQIKVSDFGIAKLAEQTSDLTMTGSVVGSPHYLSPEQIRGDELDGRSDIFSLGVLFYEVLSRQRPFTGETLTTLVYQILHRDPPSIVVNRPELGTRLESVLQRMLHKDREQRFANAGEVARALAVCEAELPASVLDRPAAPPDAPPLDGTRRMSTSERAAEVVTAGTALPSPLAGQVPPPPPPASPTQAQTELLATRVSSRGAASPGDRALGAPSSKTGLLIVAAVVVVVLGALLAGGLAARKWAAGVKKEAKSSEIAATSAEPAPAPATTVPAQPQPATPASNVPANPPPENTVPATGDSAVDAGQRYRQQTRPETAAPAPTSTTRAAPERPKGPAADPAPVSITPKRETKPEAPVPAEPEPEVTAPEEEETNEPQPPVAQRPGISPQIDRVVVSGMALSFAVEPPEALVKVDNRVIGQAWTWNAKKKDGRAYDLPEPGDHLVRILHAGKTYTLRVIASEGAPSPTVIAVNLEAGKNTRRRRANDRN